MSKLPTADRCSVLYVPPSPRKVFRLSATLTIHLVSSLEAESCRRCWLRACSCQHPVEVEPAHLDLYSATTIAIASAEHSLCISRSSATGLCSGNLFNSRRQDGVLLRVYLTLCHQYGYPLNPTDPHGCALQTATWRTQPG